MTTRVVENNQDRTDLIRLIENRQVPFTASIAKGAKRSVEQNRLQRMWVNEAAEQLEDDTPEGYRAYCKLHFGVPILRNEDEDFREAYDEIIKPMSYEKKIKAMAVPLDFPVTRLMTTKQKTFYLDQIYHHLTSLGAVLTQPKRG